MRRTTVPARSPSRAPRAAFLVGAAVAAPMAAVGVANAVVGVDAAEPGPAPSGRAPETGPADGDLAAAEAFWGAGYAYCDATALAEARGVDVWEAKVAVGAQVLTGEATAPPSGCSDAVATGADPALLAFWDAGYRYCDAAAIAAASGTDPYEAKLEVGAALVAGEPVAAPPSGCVD